MSSFQEHVSPIILNNSVNNDDKTKRVQVYTYIDENKENLLVCSLQVEQITRIESSPNK